MSNNIFRKNLSFEIVPQNYLPSFSVNWNQYLHNNRYDHTISSKKVFLSRLLQITLYFSKTQFHMITSHLKKPEKGKFSLKCLSKVRFLCFFKFLINFCNGFPFFNKDFAKTLYDFRRILC